MIEGFTKRDIAMGAIILIVATALTIDGTYYVLHAYVMYRQDTLYGCCIAAAF
jgi:hypothetical protein